MHAAEQKLKSTAEKRASMLASRGNAGHFCSVDRAAAFMFVHDYTGSRFCLALSLSQGDLVSY